MPKLFPQARKAAAFLSASDPRMKKLIARVGPMRVDLEPGRTVFEALASAIVYQQLHGKAAATILGRFKELYATQAPASFPSPAHVLATQPATLRACGLSAAKAAAILDLALHASTQRIPERPAAAAMTDEALIDALTCVRGIGRWTVEMFLIFTLARPDVWPVHDYGVRSGYAAVFGKRELPSPRELDELGRRWSPYRSFAAWYFWRATELPEYRGVKGVRRMST